MNLNFLHLLANTRKSLGWSNIKEARYMIAAVAPLSIMFSWFFHDWLLGAVLASVVVIFADRLHRQYVRALAVRIEAKDSPSWDVEVNQVKAGTITDADYATIRLRIIYDVRVYVAQILNLLRVVLNSFEYCYRAIPIGLFWVGVALAVFSPETISSVLATLQGATPDDIKRAVSMAGSMLALMMILSVGFHWAFGLSRFGFVNRFDEAIGTAVRKHCAVAADGSIHLSRWTDGSVVFPDEMAFFRRAPKS